MSQTNFPFTPYTWRLHLFGQAVLQKIFGNVDGRRSLLTVSILHHMRLCRSLQNNDGTRFLAVSILNNFPLTGNRSRKHITFTFLCRGKGHFPKKVSDYFRNVISKVTSIRKRILFLVFELLVHLRGPSRGFGEQGKQGIYFRGTGKQMPTFF